MPPPLLEKSWIPAHDNILIWSQLWQINLSTSKFIVLHLGSKNPDLEYNIDGVILESTTKCKDLGVLVTSDCKFSSHIQNISKIGYLKSRLILSIFQSKNTELLLRAYKAYIRPVLEYCSVVWSPYLIKDISVLEKVQKRFTKKILKDKSLSYCKKLELLNLESLEERRVRTDLIEAFKSLYRFQSRNPDEFFAPSLNPRKVNNLFINFSRTDCRKFWFSNRVAVIWNSLPEDIKTKKNVKQFSTAIQNLDFKSFCRGLISMAS